MSMKRARKSSSKSSQEEAPLGILGAAPPKLTWADAVANQPDDAFKPYSMTERFARNELITHSKFGKGVVTLVDGARVEVLFEEGLKKLGHAT